VADHRNELLARTHDGILRITINRPERRNALTNKLISEMTAVLAAVNADRTIKAVVITGAGDSAFSAGADLESRDTPFQFDHSVYHTPFADLLRAGQACDAPIIGRLNGACLGGGMGLLGICDIVVAAEHAVIGLPESKVGVYPLQVFAVLRDLIPRRILVEMCILGNSLTARQALEFGIVNRVVPADRLDMIVEEILAGIKAVSAVAVRRGKHALRAMNMMTFEQMISFADTQISPMASTEDAREGREAFAARRTPRWPNR
jgi:enoyl-CoA hydratase/carnithine racemase